MGVLLAVVATVLQLTGSSDVASTPTTSTTTTTTSPTTTSTSTTTSTTSTTTTTTTTTTAPEPPPVGVAPLTGRPALLGDLWRNPIVAKIDASPPAMPQVGLDHADVVIEVRVEGANRYLAVFHSRQPPVVGPHRSARTTDPHLLGLFGHPLFAFSGANPAVERTLAETWWKTGVGPGEVDVAYFRDEARPFPHNLFAHTQLLRSRPAPAHVPAPIFWYHAPGAPVAGLAAPAFAASAGTDAHFRWDPALEGWRRWVWDAEHVHADGSPVAPTNVVVIGTDHTTSHADARSPEARSVGWGPAWVFTRGTVRAGGWHRANPFDGWNLHGVDGAPLTLDPGTTWIMLVDHDPVITG